METRRKWLVPLALLALYFIWGSTFLGMKLAIESFPPFMMASLRFLFAGVLLYAVLRMTGAPAPSRAEWGGAAVVGVLLLSVGNAGVAYCAAMGGYRGGGHGDRHGADLGDPVFRAVGRVAASA